jgi:hypothetical protein
MMHSGRSLGFLSLNINVGSLGMGSMTDLNDEMAESV